MESAKFPWWVGIPASIGVTIMGIVAPTFLPVWVQAVLFGLGVLAVAWSILAGVWHYRASWGKRMASAALLLAIGLLIVISGLVLTWWGTSAIAALSKKPVAVAGEKAASRPPDALASTEPTITQNTAVTVPLTSKGAASLSMVVTRAATPPATSRVQSNPPLSTGRFVVQGVRVEEDGKDSDTLGLTVSVKNTGPGLAYAGTAITNYAFFDPGPLPSNLEGTFNNLLTRARKVRPKKEVQQDGGTEFSFPVSIRLPRGLVDEMIAGKRGMAVWVHYAFYTEGTPRHKIEIASLLLVYSGLGTGRWHESTERQFTKTYKELP